MKPTRRQRNSPLFAAVSLLTVVLACPLRADPPHVKVSTRQKLTRSLRASAGPARSAWRKLLAAHVDAEEVKGHPGRWQRSPQGFVGDVQRVTVTPNPDKAAPYHGVIVVGVEWKTPRQFAFKSQAEALAAKLTESEPGQLYLLYVYQRGAWHYLRGVETPPTQADWKPRPKPEAPNMPDA